MLFRHTGPRRLVKLAPPTVDLDVWKQAKLRLLSTMQASGNIGHPARFAVAFCGHEIATFSNWVWLDIVLQATVGPQPTDLDHFYPILSDSIYSIQGSEPT